MVSLYLARQAVVIGEDEADGVLLPHMSATDSQRVTFLCRNTVENACKDLTSLDWMKEDVAEDEDVLSLDGWLSQAQVHMSGSTRIYPKRTRSSTTAQYK